MCAKCEEGIEGKSKNQLKIRKSHRRRKYEPHTFKIVHVRVLYNLLVLIISPRSCSEPHCGVFRFPFSFKNFLILISLWATDKSAAIPWRLTTENNTTHRLQWFVNED